MDEQCVDVSMMNMMDLINIGMQTGHRGQARGRRVDSLMYVGRPVAEQSVLAALQTLSSSRAHAAGRSVKRKRGVGLAGCGRLRYPNRDNVPKSSSYSQRTGTLQPQEDRRLVLSV